jgi:predicted lipoprotein with Yx(FWY)xxD motif
MKVLVLLAIVAAAAVAGCGSDDEEPAPVEPQARATAQARATPQADEQVSDSNESEAKRGTRLRVGGSEFGRMVFDADEQAIYIFERDRKNRSVCYGECAEAWPPVFTDGKPVAGRGIRRSLLGTMRRRGGRRQVTYAGNPLYYYAHEDPGEVLCHNVNLNGGLWWVVGPNGKRRP